MNTNAVEVSRQIVSMKNGICQRVSHFSKSIQFDFDFDFKDMIIWKFSNVMELSIWQMRMESVA